MLNAQAEFQRRKVEIEEYISHLEALEKDIGFSVSLMNTMKSSTLLMIYNIVESTMTNLLQDVFDHLEAQKVNFDALNDTMKALVLGYAKKRNPTELVKRLAIVSAGLSVAPFDRSDVFSGNLDSKQIRATLKQLGVTASSTYTEAALLTVKAERNDLAHGNKSFSDCGKTYSAKQLLDIHRKTASTLTKVISDFDAFLLKKAYA